MPLIQKHNTAANFGRRSLSEASLSGTKNKTNSSPLLNVRREDIFYREDIKMTFVYALIGISALAILGAFGYMGVQQLRK